MRTVLNRETVVRVHVDDEDGALTAADSTPTITVKDGDGVAVTGVSDVTEDGTGVYKATIPAHSSYDRLTVSWSVTIGGSTRTVVDYVDVVSERLVPLWRLREDSELADVSGALLRRIEDTVAEWFRDALKYPPVVESFRRSWLLEYPVQRLVVPGGYFPHDLLALTYARGNASLVWDETMLARVASIETGFEWLDSGTFAPIDFLRGQQRGTFMVGYYSVKITHGGGGDFELLSPTEDMRRAAATLCRYVARASNLPERARRIETSASIIDLSMPSPNMPTGLPDVDAVIGRYRIQAL